MVLSPRPEQAQLHVALKTPLISWSAHSMIDEEMDSIPSPPQSPRWGSYRGYAAPVPVSGTKPRSAILVAPLVCKDTDIVVETTLGFLSQYRHFNNTRSTPVHSEPNVRATRSNNTATHPVSKPSEQRTSPRRVPRKNYKLQLEDELDSFVAKSTKQKVRKSVTPVRSHARSNNHSTLPSSPIASANALNGASQYEANMSWAKLVDYSPPLSTLPPNNNKSLRIEWKGSPMDLSNDPLKDKLHPAELVLAEILRLPCDLYLDSKRRFFLEKVHKLKKGLPFRRTDAQKACRIDVNKASRLYAAFEKVHWLDDSNFEKFL